MPQTASEERYLLSGFWKHGRYYGAWKPGKYNLPIDSEELNRLDIFHKVHLLACDGLDLDYALSTDRPCKVLDLGAGTGIWSIHVSEDYPRAEVMAVDLNQIQPPLIPRGMKTLQFDLEEPSWDPLIRDCDLAYMRLLFGSIQTDLWPDVYKRTLEHLAPGRGWLQHSEIDWTPHWEGGEVPSPSSLEEWCGLYLDGLDRSNRSGRVIPGRTKKMLEEAGFVDISQETVRCYVNPWSDVKQEREIARWFNLVCAQGLEAMSLIPMIDYGRMSYDQVRELCARTKKEICVLRFHAYVTMYVWKARRPASGAK